MIHVPTVAEIRAARKALGDLVVTTPIFEWQGEAVEKKFGPGTKIVFKLELFQKTGTFKPRGALTVMLNLSKDQLKIGVTAVSAGNHAIAVAYAAKVLGTTAKLVMKESVNPYRLAIVKSFGPKIVFTKDFHLAFDEAERIQREEGRVLIHPFEGPNTFLGTATCGLEFAEQAPNLDAAIVAIGGGGLGAGFAAALKQLQPHVDIYGVEPYGADTMYRSFQSGEPETIPEIKTIADSLGAPMSRAGGVELCKKFIKEIIRISDEEMITAMRLLFEDMKLAVEPAGAAAIAALMGPLKEKLSGKRVGILVCGSNISAEDFCKLIY